MSGRTPLVLLPGLLCDGALWAHQVRTLADVAEPMVGDITGHDTVAALATAVLARAPDRFALAGLSMGGYVAMEIMRQAPGRVERLALLDTSPHPDKPEQSERRRALMDMARHGQFKGVTPRLLPMLIHPDRLDDHPLTAEVMAMAERVGQEAFFRQQTAIMERPDSVPSLAAVNVPTLVLCGREDGLTPLSLHQEMAAAIPGARLVVVEGSGHLSAMERPEAVSAVLRYWLQV